MKLKDTHIVADEFFLTLDPDCIIYLERSNFISNTNISSENPLIKINIKYIKFELYFRSCCCCCFCLFMVFDCSNNVPSVCCEWFIHSFFSFYHHNHGWWCYMMNHTNITDVYWKFFLKKIISPSLIIRPEFNINSIKLLGVKWNEKKLFPIAVDFFKKKL